MRASWVVGGVVLALAFGGVGWSWVSTRWYRGAMSNVDTAVAAGRFGVAARDLTQVLSWKPNSAEAAYVLGMCEQSRGRTKEADEAWARVDPASAFGERAFLARLRLLHDTGRLADAERLVLESAEDRLHDRAAQLVLLAPIYAQVGRTAEAKRLIEARWDQLAKAGEAARDQSIKLVRAHIELKLKAPSDDQMRAYLDEMARLSPEDDRVWLGRAHLAIRTGKLDDAKRWLDACQAKRPEDAAVWRERLEWGMASGRVDVVQEAQKHLEPQPATASERHRLSAWLSRQQRDVAGERTELQALITIDPDDRPALDRLAELATGADAAAQKADIAARKAELDRVWARYVVLYDRTQHVRDAEEMARLAERLGRFFEAKVFLSLALENEPGRKDLRNDLERVREKCGR